MGAWIEIGISITSTYSQPKSLLSWERGLKSKNCNKKAGHKVAPLVGAWIEIFFRKKAVSKKKSLLSWERGLKFRRI